MMDFGKDMPRLSGREAPLPLVFRQYCAGFTPTSQASRDSYMFM